MFSKLRRNLSSGIRGSLGLQIHNERSMEKLALNHKTRERERKANFNIVSPSHRKIKVMRR